MNRREILRLLSYSGVTITNIGAVASFFNSSVQQAFAGDRVINDKYGLVILVDGWRADMFNDMLSSGELPNIKKHLVDRGTTVDNFVGTFPSTTGPAHLPYITGIMPGHNNCPGLRWVDRRTHEIRDYCTIDNFFFNNDFPGHNYTIYELLQNELTTCIFDFASRGATSAPRPSVKTLWWIVSGNQKAWEAMDDNALNVFEATFAKSELSRYTFLWFPALDHLTHMHGTKSEEVWLRAKGIDVQVGRIMEKLHKARIYDKTIVTLVADHGLRDTHTNTDPGDILEKIGFRVLPDLSAGDDFTSLQRYTATRGVSGNGYAMLYFAKTINKRGIVYPDWAADISYSDIRSFHIPGEGRVDLIDVLRKEKSIKLVMVKKSEDQYMVFSRKGEGEIDRNLSDYKYSVKGDDPLGYDKNPSSKKLMDGKHYHKDKWFLATTDTNHPDALFQISQIFDSNRCGEIILSSEPGYDFLKEGHVGTHGGLEKAEMMIPCVIAGPGIKHGRIPIARSVDIFPTYLKSFGIPKYDGDILNVFS